MRKFEPDGMAETFEEALKQFPELHERLVELQNQILELAMGQAGKEKMDADSEPKRS